MDPIGSGSSVPIAPTQRAIVRGQTADPKLERAAEQLEAHFLSRVLGQMHAAGGSTFGSGLSGSVYQGMLDEKLAESMANDSPLGLKDMLVRELSTQRTAELERDGLRSLPGFHRISSGYGLRQHPVTGEQKFHHGWDLPAETGTPVTAARAGLVSFSGTKGGFGEVVEISHADGSHSVYAHLSRRTASAGESVGPGTKIGEVGESGTATGPHLHFEVRQGVRSIDPATWLTTTPMDSTDDLSARLSRVDLRGESPSKEPL